MGDAEHRAWGAAPVRRAEWISEYSPRAVLGVVFAPVLVLPLLMGIRQLARALAARQVRRRTGGRYDPEALDAPFIVASDAPQAPEDTKDPDRDSDGHDTLERIALQAFAPATPHLGPPA